VEGSIGGTVNLRRASAFDNPGLHLGAHAEGNYNDMSELYGQKYSLFVENTFAEQTLGFVLGGVHSSDHVRTDSLNAYNQNIYGPLIYPFTANPGDPGSVPLMATPEDITFGSIFDNKKRDALSGSLEWRPNSAFTLKVDGLWTHLDDPQIGYNQSYYFAAPDSTGFYGDGTPWADNVVLKNGIITSMSVNEFQPEMVNNTQNRKVDTYLYGLNASWKPTDRLSFAFDGYRSTASRPEGGQDTFVTAGLVNAQPTAVDILNLTALPHSLPNINVVLPPDQLGLTACPSGSASTTNAGYCSYTALMNSGFLNNNKYWSTHYDGFNGYSVHDEIVGLNLDGAWETNLGMLQRLSFGAGYTDRKKDRVTRRSTTRSRCRRSTPTTPIPSPRRLSPATCRQTLPRSVGRETSESGWCIRRPPPTLPRPCRRPSGRTRNRVRRRRGTWSTAPRSRSALTATTPWRSPR